MNYLAHAYLSFMHEEVLIGNMISDFVKGKKKFNYSADIQKGIHLHREIDAFTDEHVVTKDCKKYFKSAVGLYSGAFVDVAYDHFLAKEPGHWKNMPLEQFAIHIYSVLKKHYVVIPEQMQQMLPYMINQNWLLNYQHKWGVEKSFQGVARRAVYLNSSMEVYNAFEKAYNDLETLSNLFLPDVKKFAAERFHRLLRA